LSCANSEIRELDNIGQLIQLRFLDLGNNLITNITPLENLRQLSGLNLAGNQVNDISPLLNIPSLTSVILDGNPSVPCDQLVSLRLRLGDKLSEPTVCSE
jgi:internalin A